MQAEVAWVAVDWGTSNVRAWGISTDGAVVFSESSDRGMSRITPADYPDILRGLMSPHIGDEAPPVLICGMAGARQGWREAPYLETPCRLTNLAQGAVTPPGIAGVEPRILPGVCQRQTGAEDVMRGEETQLLGLLSLRPNFSGVVVMPGTHSKWVEIRDGAIVRFNTAMTGELFDVLSTHSVLRHSFTGERDGLATEDGISDGLTAGLEHPELATASLFRTRAAALLSGKGADWCVGYLSGLLIGAEIGGHRDWIASGVVPLIGSERLCRVYVSGFSKIGVTAEIVDATDATLAGLKLAYRSAA